MARASTRRPCQCWREDSQSALHLLTSCRITKKLLKKNLQTLTIVFDQNHGLQHLKCKWRSCVLTISFPPSGASQLSSVWRVNKCLSPALKGRTLHPPSKIASQWLMLSGLSPPHIFHKVQIISPQPCKTKCTCGRALGHSEKKNLLYHLFALAVPLRWLFLLISKKLRTVSCSALVQHPNAIWS